MSDGFETSLRRVSTFVDEKHCEVEAETKQNPDYSCKKGSSFAEVDTNFLKDPLKLSIAQLKNVPDDLLIC